MGDDGVEDGCLEDDSVRDDVENSSGEDVKVENIGALWKCFYVEEFKMKDVHLKGLQVEVVQRGQIQVEATGIEEVWVVGSNMGKIVVRKNLCSRDMQKAVDIGNVEV